jgi:hypothetical protein
MNWFYAINDQQPGPVSDEQLDQLFASGQINGDTLVWREGMANWQPLSTVRAVAAAPTTGAVTATCAECGQVFSVSNLIQLGGVSICARCKPIYLQKMSEGVATPSVGNMWRMNKQLVTISEAPFPDRCVKCNAPANGYRLKRALSWHHPGFYFFLLCNLLIYAIVALSVRKKALLHIGLCEQHRAKRKQTILISVIGTLAGVAMGFAGGAFDSGWLIFLGFLMFFGFLIYGLLKAQVVSAAKITKENVWLKGVHQDFMTGLPEWPGK